MIYSLTLTILLTFYTAPSPPVIPDYDQALALAKQSGKPVFLLFTSSECSHNEAIQKLIQQDEAIQEYLKKHYINAWLYVDDAQPLPEPKRISLRGGPTTFRTYGDRWAHLEWVKFQQNIQPLAAIVNEKGTVVGEAVTFKELQSDFLAYLKRGVSLSK